MMNAQANETTIE